MALFVFVVGIVASLAASHLQASMNRRVLEQRLTRTLAYVAGGVETRLRDYVQVLQGVRGLVINIGPDQISAPQMQRYLESIDSERVFAGARGFGFVRRVPRAEQDAFLRRQPAEQGEPYTVHELGPNDGERFLIQLVLPPGRNRVARGLDLASEPNRRAAAVAAMESGTANLTAPITLVQSAGVRNRGFLLLLPVYSGTDMPSTALRAKSLVGWTYAPLQLDTVLQGLLDANEDVSIALDDIDEFGTTAVLPRVVPGRQAVVASTDLSIFGRRWRLALTGGAAFEAQQGLTTPGMVFAVGAAITLALTVLAISVTSVRWRHRQVLAEQAKLAAIVDSSIDAIIGKDLSGRITSWNHGAEMLFGYRACEAIGRTVAELLVPPDRQFEETEVLSQLAAGGAMPNLETQRRHSQGHLIDVWMAIAPIRAPDGRVIGVATTVRDITERRAAEAQVRLSNVQLEETVASRTTQLRRLNGLLSSVLDAAAGVAIVATDIEGTITVFNRGAELLLGYRAGDMVGRATPLAFHDAAEVAQRAADISAAEGVTVDGIRTFVFYPERDGAETREWTYVRRDGKHIVVSLIVTVIRDHGGRIEGYLGIAVDVTDRMALLDSLRDAKERADAASEAKSSFLANMSHEIRTPMNAVLGMLQLLETTRLDARQQDYASKAGHAARSLLRLLNDVLDYSKMNAGKFVLDPHPFELEGLMRDLAAILSGNHGGKPVEVVFDMDPHVPPSLLGDRMRLHQILTNLAGNALKFTDSGSVTVRVGLLAHVGAAVHVRFEVIDTGIGIGPEQRERIFDGFTQAEASISRRFGGTGLGLVLCRHLVELMGGQLHLDSRLGAGSRFWFDLELGEASGPRVASQRPGLRVLVVDDQADASSALAKMVEGLGWHAKAVAGGQEALQRLQQAPEDALFEVVLLDWRMPGLDGLELARIIRRDLAHPPVVLMVTAYGREMLLDEQTGDDAAPFADVLTKPVTPQLVSEAVLRALEPATPSPSPPQRARLAGMRILLVEDNPLNRQVASELLEAEGASVDVAEDGRQGVDYLMHASPLPDAVLMDVQMPIMDGLEATRLIRAKLGTALPIIAMTANVSAADQAQCFEAGMNSHVDKPVDIERLVAVLRPALHSPVTNDQRPKRAPALARFGGNAAVYLRSLDEFVPAAVKLVAQARTAIIDDDRMTVSGALHSLKGMAGTIGADDVAAAASALEASARQFVEANKLLIALDECERQVEVSERRLREVVQAPVSQLSPKPSALQPVLSLDELAVLLTSSDLRALDIVDQLEVEVSADPAYMRLIGQVRELDFAEALSTVNVLRNRYA